jgi:polyferredoxin
MDISNAGQNFLERLFFGILMLIGTITSLAYFHFGARSTPDGPKRSKLVIVLGWIGQIFIAITLGVLFAGVFAAAMTALIERLNFLWSFLAKLL